MNRTINVLGIVLVFVAIGTCLLLGTFGWFAVGFAMMTDCTNNYSCSQTGCKPCATTSRWITGGGAAQWLLAATGVAVLIRGTRVKQPTYLAFGGAVLLAVSVMASSARHGERRSLTASRAPRGTTAATAPSRPEARVFGLAASWR